jgi:hypothetical protein
MLLSNGLLVLMVRLIVWTTVSRRLALLVVAFLTMFLGVLMGCPLPCVWGVIVCLPVTMQPSWGGRSLSWGLMLLPRLPTVLFMGLCCGDTGSPLPPLDHLL